MASEFVETLKREHPDLVRYLEQRDISNFKPDPTRISNALASMKRPACWTCETPNAQLRCTGCRVARYCNKECQALQWDEHKPMCALTRGLSQSLKEGLFQGHADE
jgi:hypothetical protein